MSPATTVNPAWLTVPPEDGLPEEVAAQIGPVADKIGFVPNVARLLAISPRHFTGWWGYFDELMRGPSGLSKTQREMIAVVVSAEARCPYCEAAHAAALRLRTKDPELADRLVVNYRHVGLTEPELARAVEVAEATHRTTTELLFERSRELLHNAEVPGGVALRVEPTSRLDEMVALGASIGANCHPLLQQHIAAARQQGLTVSQVRSAIKMAGIVQRHAADITVGKAAAAVEAAEPRPAAVS